MLLRQISSVWEANIFNNIYNPKILVNIQTNKHKPIISGLLSKARQRNAETQIEKV